MKGSGSSVFLWAFFFKCGFELMSLCKPLTGKLSVLFLILTIACKCFLCSCFSSIYCHFSLFFPLPYDYGTAMSDDPDSLIAVILSFTYDELRWMLEETDEQCAYV